MKPGNTFLICIAIMIVGTLAWAGVTNFSSITLSDDLIVGDDLSVDGDSNLKAVNIPDDTAITLGTDSDATIKYDENGDDELIITSTDIKLDALLLVDGVVEVESAADQGEPAFVLNHQDEDQPFVKYQGTEDSDTSKHLSTQQGDGAVDGPKIGTGQAGWEFAKMILVQINEEATGYWLPVFKNDPAD